MVRMSSDVTIPRSQFPNQRYRLSIDEDGNLEILVDEYVEGDYYYNDPEVGITINEPDIRAFRDALNKLLGA